MTAATSRAYPTGGKFAPVTMAFMNRGIIRVLRMPTIMMPMIVMPVFFVVGFSGSFAGAVQIDGYGTDKAINWMTAWAVLQGAGFAGMGAAGAAATDLENGFFDRIRLAPVHPMTVIAGLLMYSITRALLPITAVLLVAFGLLDADLPGGFLGLVSVYVAGVGIGVVMSLLALSVVFTIKTLQALGFVQILIFGLMFLSIGQAPLEAMDGWLHTAATINPVTRIMILCRQGFLGEVTWGTTWPGLLAIAGMVGLFGTLAVWRFRQITD